jgi:competence protein ComEC
MNLYFPQLGNANSGDCVLVKVGNTEVLIDAGSKRDCASTLVPYIKKYCTDGILEYVIATHAHEDHIAAFVGNTNNKTDGVFDNFEVGTIIDYTQKNTTSQISKDYEALRDSLVKKGTKHYNALECWKQTGGAKRSYTLGEGITMNILYQKYYEQSSGDENEYSVCMLLKDGKNNYLFTGDLESGGEKSLVAENDLPRCKLFKGGHHGSPTSSSLELLKVIQPEIVCVCCCCGATEYTSNMDNVFPSQAFVDRVGLYTSQIYVTSMISADGKSGISMNGNIIVSSKGGVVSVICSNNNTVFKETAWFKQYRSWPKGGK